jgi:hypothetical protein
MLPLPHIAFARIMQNHGTQEFAAARTFPTLQANPLPFSTHMPASFCLIFPEAVPLSGIKGQQLQ